MFARSVALVALLAAVLLWVGDGEAYGRFGQRARERPGQQEPAMKKKNAFEKRDTSGYRYYNNFTASYFIESLPEVDADLGEIYSGLIPIDYSDASRALFYVFQPTIGAPVDEVTIWLNGGPGCSSLEGFFQENGPIVWQPGVYAPIANPYSWVNLTNMLWVEQPVGTGFAIGTPTATTQEETAEDFILWFKNFQDIFGIKNYKIYVTGESYAGRYVPYVSAAMLDQNNTEHYNLSGALVYDPCIGQFDYSAEEAVAVPFAIANNNILNLNDTFIETLTELHESCGYKAYLDEYLVFPASGVQPAISYNETFANASCDVFDMINNAALTLNPCFNIYWINQQCPLLYDVLGFPTDVEYMPPGAPTVYFNRTDVKKAIHAPLDVDWAECANQAVFVGPEGAGPEGEGDLSADPIQKVLPQVIEATNRVLIANGEIDMILISDGVLVSIQNMTWNGKLGFDSKPSTPIDITLPDLQYASVLQENGYGGLDSVQGIMGTQHYERGLMWATTLASGHMQPEFQPRVSYRHLEWVLGRVESL